MDEPVRNRRTLVVGIGNVLRGDDGFGPAVVQVLETDGDLPPGVHTLELGIGGIGLVHELMNGYDSLILADAMDRNGAPGSLYITKITVPDIASIPGLQRYQLGGDAHQTVPTPALLMAKALGILPPIVHMVGCQPAETEEFSTELSLIVQQTIPAAIEAIRTLAQRAPEEDGATDHGA